MIKICKKLCLNMPVTIRCARGMFFSLLRGLKSFSLHFLDFPQIVNLKVMEDNVNITWELPFEGECHVFGYLIYYRKVISEVNVNTSKWNVVNLSQYNATNHNLQLQCYTEYEITVTAQSANGETPLNQSKLWKVKTGGK